MNAERRHARWPTRPWRCTWLLALCLVVAGARAAAAPVPLLWKVDGERGSALYLLGSFHLLRPADYPPAEVVTTTLAHADRVVFELAPEEMLAPGLAARLERAGRRVSGRLQDELAPEEWTRLQAAASRAGLDVQALQGLRPWFVALTLGVGAMTRQGLDPGLGLDRWLMQQAQAAGKPALGLETADEQIALLADMDAPAQRQMLAGALEQADDEDATAALHAAWRAGDAAALQTLAGKPMQRRQPALYRRMLAARNRRWLQRLQPWLRPGQGNTLVVVGALHLVGDQGLVRRLQARGYRVERLPPAGMSR